MFSETEKLHALNRRYTSPDENAFYPHLLPEPLLPSIQYPRVLNPNRININDQIMSVYLEKILPGISENKSDPTSVRWWVDFASRIHLGLRSYDVPLCDWE
jgi:chorismate mutase